MKRKIFIIFAGTFILFGCAATNPDIKPYEYWKYHTIPWIEIDTTQTPNDLIGDTTNLCIKENYEKLGND